MIRTTQSPHDQGERGDSLSIGHHIFSPDHTTPVPESVQLPSSGLGKVIGIGVSGNSIGSGNGVGKSSSIGSTGKISSSKSGSGSTGKVTNSNGTSAALCS